MKWYWVQLNVALVRHDGEALPSARALFARLEPLVTRWRNDGLLRWFFFMRKPPDVRLRFATRSCLDAMRELSDHAVALQQEGVISGFFFARYQPETQRFGGTKAMTFVHEFFDADTSMWVKLDRLDQQAFRVLAPEVIVPSVLNDLFVRALANGQEVVAMWRYLGALRRIVPGAVVPRFELLSIDALHGRIEQHLEASGILRRYVDANTQLAGGLAGFCGHGDRLIQVLADVAVFTLHRHGFNGNESALLIENVRRSARAIPRQLGPHT